MGAKGDTGVEKPDVVLTVNVENIHLGEDVDILDREDDLTGGERRGVVEDGHVVDEHSKFSLLQCVEGILSIYYFSRCASIREATNVQEYLR